MPFTGFSDKTFRFFEGLKENNNKLWFEDNREVFDREVLAPAKEFVVDMGQKLIAIAPEIQFAAKIDGSIFRIHRDVRFSKDKSPYKTHLGILFWEGTAKKVENSGFYFHIEPPDFYFGAGLYIFPRYLLQTYREAVDHPKTGPELVKAIKKVQKAGPYDIGGEHYKQIPRGFDKEHPRADLLRHNGLWASTGGKLNDDFKSEQLIEFCFAHYKKMLPIHTWCRELTKLAK